MEYSFVFKGHGKKKYKILEIYLCIWGEKKKTSNQLDVRTDINKSIFQIKIVLTGFPLWNAA